MQPGQRLTRWWQDYVAGFLRPRNRSFKPPMPRTRTSGPIRLDP